MEKYISRPIQIKIILLAICKVYPIIKIGKINNFLTNLIAILNWQAFCIDFKINFARIKYMRNSTTSKQLYTIKNKSYTSDISFPKTIKKPTSYKIIKTKKNSHQPTSTPKTNDLGNNTEKLSHEREKLETELTETNRLLQQRDQEINSLQIDMQQAKKKNSKLEKIIANQQHEIEKVQSIAKHKDIKLKETVKKYKSFDTRIEQSLNIIKREKHKRKVTEKDLAQAIRHLKKAKEYASKKSKLIYSMQVERQMTMHKVRHLVNEYYKQKLVEP
jgi:chromosome segregation ATPase